MDELRLVVVVDTTTTFTDVMMTRRRWMQLLTLCAKGDLRLAVPLVVLRETARHWEKQAAYALSTAKDRHDRYESSREKLDSLGLDVGIEPGPVPADVGIDATDFLRDTTARLLPLGVEILPVPTVTIEQVLERDLARKKPFATSGKGFRDVLVWEATKELLAGLHPKSVVFFVTDNTDDYCLDDRLHPDLVPEISPLDVDFRIVKTLDSLLTQKDLEAHVDRLLADDEELARSLSQVTEPDEPNFEGPSVGDIVKGALVSAAEDLLHDEVETADVTSSGLDFTALMVPPEIESPYIGSIEVDADSVAWETYETYDQTTLLVSGSIAGAVTLEGYVFKGDYGGVDESIVTVLDWDWNDHMAQVATTVSARLVFQLRVEVGVGVDDVEFEVAEPA